MMCPVRLRFNELLARQKMTLEQVHRRVGTDRFYWKHGKNRASKTIIRGSAGWKCSVHPPIYLTLEWLGAIRDNVPMVMGYMQLLELARGLDVSVNELYDIDPEWIPGSDEYRNRWYLKY